VLVGPAPCRGAARSAARPPRYDRAERFGRATRSGQQRGDEAELSRSGRKIVQYLNEAHAAEVGMRREIQAQLATTPPGRYHAALERHLRETIRHAERLSERLVELGESRGRAQLGIGTASALAAQLGIDTASALAAQLLNIGKVPLELVRGAGSEERVLRNARDSCAAEALEIAAYTALERLAKDADDRRTAKLAAWIRADEEAMLKKILAEIPALTDAVARASFEIVPPKALTRTTGDAAARQPAGRHAVANGRASTNGAAGRSAAGSPAAARAVNEATGELRTATAAARRNAGSANAPKAREPWVGYDRLTAVAIIAALDGASEATVRRTRGYERTRKNRATVIQATERELARS
jgi:ferritin-like metal-binding protein YciE